MFESVEEVDQIETEPKSEEAKQLPKMTNGTLQNGTSSPDSGHPSSRNFSVTSGLSDGSFSTEDGSAPDASLRPADLLSGQQNLVVSPKDAGVTEEVDTRAEGGLKGKDERVEKGTDAIETEVEVVSVVKPPDEVNKEPDLTATTQSLNVESEAANTVKAQVGGSVAKVHVKGKETSGEVNMIPESRVVRSREKKDIEKTYPKKPAEATERIKQDRSTSAMAQNATVADEKKEPRLSEVERNLLLSADSRVSRAREAYSQKDEVQVMTESDESPSAIEMEEIPKANVSMVPWSRKGHCDPTPSEDSASHIGHEQGKPSPEGTESLLSDEPEMEDLSHHADSLAQSAASQQSSGSAFSVRPFKCSHPRAHQSHC